MKVRSTRGGWGLVVKKLNILPIVLLSCFAIIFFLAGYFFGSMLFLSEDNITESIRTRSILESVADKDRRQESFIIPHGDTGDSFVTKIPFQVLSWKPRIVHFPGFATAEQCQNMITKAKNAKPIQLNETFLDDRIIDTSTSSFHYASEDKTGTIYQIEQKIARATMIPRTYGEPFKVLQYEVGQRRVTHQDAYDLRFYGPEFRQRVATFLLYLSDVEEGGETNFPLENGSNMNIEHGQPNNDNVNKCIGLKVKPRQGDGLLFYSLYPNGTIDPLSFHGSCPVILGKKWVATKWITIDQERNTTMTQSK